MHIKDSVVLITGANRGLGLALAKAALAGGARKVYGAARDAGSVTLPGVIPVRLDVTKDADIATLARELGDVTILVNNAGIIRPSTILADDSVAAARAELETNMFGPMALSKAFAPVLHANGGGAIVNILSALSWLSIDNTATYSVSKAAAWALTNGLRNELAGQGTQVLAAHMGYMDTDMTAGQDVPKARPEDVARTIFEALQGGADEVLADDLTRQVKQGLGAARGMYLGQPRAA
jgi:NAD(P)-dependent dehydrogenase (short-subunit alcohol dehydrogenase family)